MLPPPTTQRTRLETVLLVKLDSSISRAGCTSIKDKMHRTPILLYRVSTFKVSFFSVRFTKLKLDTKVYPKNCSKCKM